mgnify:CR=1 FL=1
MQVRTDLVLLLIMNGNDYLPKLRGSSGFDKLFGSYNKGRTPGEAVGLSRKQKEAARLAALEKAEPPQVQEVPSTSTSVSPSSTRPRVNAKPDLSLIHI